MSEAVRAWLDVRAPARAAVRLLDRLLRRRLGIEQFSDSPQCLLRVALAPAPDELRFADGTRVARGEMIGELHWWNEHVPALPAGGPTFRWATELFRGARRSLAELAVFVESEPRFRDVRAFGADAVVFSENGAASIALPAERLGFERMARPEPAGFGPRCRRWGESLLSAALLWAYNPNSRYSLGLPTARCRLYMTRARLLRYTRMIHPPRSPGFQPGDGEAREPGAGQDRQDARATAGSHE